MKNKIIVAFETIKATYKDHPRIKWFIIFRSINYANGLLISPFFLNYFGFEGALVPVIGIAILLGYRLLRLYDTNQIDCFLLEEFKRERELDRLHLLGDKTPKLIRTIIRISNRKFGIVLLFAFFVIWDPMVIVIYYRIGYGKYNGFTTIKTRIFFVLTAIVSSTLWLLQLKTGISIIEIAVRFAFVHPYITLCCLVSLILLIYKNRKVIYENIKILLRP